MHVQVLAGWWALCAVTERVYWQGGCMCVVGGDVCEHGGELSATSFAQRSCGSCLVVVVVVVVVVV